ncbi:MAG: sugar-transfer associated ATP-grasp domain-containing protein, partial [Erysipelotrichia bacterium]|nr:sugar-transfer associated ATP-grasp domain-containing protein [Erysipelotrichia bacterium]
SISYLIKRIMHMDYKSMLNKINKIHKKTGKSRLSIFLDMKDCAVKYGAGYSDYDLYEMYNLTDQQRDTYITRGRNNDLVLKYNQKEYFHLIDNKAEFNTLFEKYLKRDWIKVDGTEKERVLDFLRKHQTFMTKPMMGSCGKKIEKLNTKDFASLEELYDYLNNKNFILEEIIIQNEQVAAVYPGSINTVRVVTILKDDIPHVICAYFRIGNGKFVDNFNSGGMVAPVDIKTGIVRDAAIDKQKNLYTVHPLTGHIIKGFQFPDWQQALDMCKEASHVVKQMGYIGWDVGFSTKGPLFVEANEYPGHDIYQLPQHTPDKQGMWPLFNNI